MLRYMIIPYLYCVLLLYSSVSFLLVLGLRSWLCRRSPNSAEPSGHRLSSELHALVFALVTLGQAHVMPLDRFLRLLMSKDPKPLRPPIARVWFESAPCRKIGKQQTKKKSKMTLPLMTDGGIPNTHLVPPLSAAMLTSS